ncbi:uncharacterized protein DUF3618 [Labedella gwakjiensis]|uniref:DUF3618 domain-containing protein n=1 Tax=Labedella gwakjiensis TaxID=390269 RepID=A0A2P8GT40_9MICO|nr:DUF3618 domain-containing protein [Labedella gwakjiensis]PSL37115.1 uncharacterized protein DUF3618 [Labedella gwakjiensis]RUQ81982.1 DUF3618 domain-containing protein [Labedella gwakjiensis]
MPDADDVESVRDEFAETLDAIEKKIDPRHRARDVIERVRSRAIEQPIPVAAIAVAGLAVLALGATVAYRIARR